MHLPKSKGFDKRAIAARPKSSLKSADSDDYLDITEELTSLENVRSDFTTTPSAAATKNSALNESDASTMPATTERSTELELARTIMTTESPTANSATSSYTPSSTEEFTSTIPHDETSAEKGAEFVTAIQSLVEFPEFTRNSAESDGNEKAESSTKNVLEKITTEPSFVNGTAKPIIPIRTEISTDNSLTPQPTNVSDSETPQIIGGFLKQQPSLFSLLVRMNSNQPISDKQKELSRKINEEGKLALAIHPNDHIFVVGEGTHRRNPNETPAESRIVTFSDQNGLRRVRIQENREAAPNEDSKSEVVDESLHGNFSTSQNTKVSLNVTPEATDAASQNGNEERTRELVERDDARLVIMPRLVSVTEDPQASAEMTLIKETDLTDDVEGEQFQRQPTQIVPQTRHNMDHQQGNSKVLRDLLPLDGTDTLGELSNLFSDDRVESIHPSQPTISAMQQPIITLPSSNFDPSVSAQQPFPIPQNFASRAIPMPQNFEFNPDFVPPDLVPQFVPQQPLQQQEEFVPQPQVYLMEIPGTEFDPGSQLFLLPAVPTAQLPPQPVLRTLPSPSQFPPPLLEPPVPSASIPPQATHPPPQFPTRFEVFDDLTEPSRMTTTVPVFVTRPIAKRIFSKSDQSESIAGELNEADGSNENPRDPQLMETAANESADEESVPTDEAGGRIVQKDSNTRSRKRRSVMYFSKTGIGSGF
ncbi:unnamed protein product [Toxocara canis]|uniref:BRCT domain-containing protein n=1 Tax=Toxocara canis TaxID=6265 RepID=A0A183V0V0_TOXCA|nr:unnamed protein product [Toxocara canis]